MNRKHVALLVLAILICVIAVASAYYSNTAYFLNLPTPTPSPSPIHSSTPSPAVPSSSPTVTITNTPNPTSSPSSTSSTSPTPTPASTSTPVTNENNPQTITIGDLGKYQTIQAGVNAVVNEAIIKVSTGIYPENIVISGSKKVLLQGGWDKNFVSRTNDSSLTVIDGDLSDSVLSIQSDAGQSLNVTIEGLTIRNGVSTDGGGLKTSSNGEGSTLELNLINSIIENNVATIDGGGLMANSGDKSMMTLSFINNTFSGNNATSAGGGIWLNSHHSVLFVSMVQNNIVSNKNSDLDGGGLAAYASGANANTTLVMENNFVFNNLGSYGGGLWFYSWGQSSIMNVTLTNNIIANNHAPVAFGGIGFMSDCNASGVLTMINNDVVYNDADDSGGIFITSGGGLGEGIPPENDAALVTVTIENNIIWGNYGKGGSHDIDIYSYLHSCPAQVRISYSIFDVYTSYQADLTISNCLNQDPLFIDYNHQNFHLQNNSPAIDWGNPNPEFNDQQSPPGKGTIRCDIGSYGGYNNYKWL